LQQTLVHIKEQILLEQLAAGEPAAKELFYDKYAGALYGVILQIIPVREVADEVMVKTFTHVYQYIHEYKNSANTNLFAWLLRKTREIAIGEILPLGYGATGNDLMVRNNSHLQQFAAGLSDERQQVFRLCYFRGVSQMMVATILGVEEETVKQILRATMIELRKFLKNTWS